MSFCYDTFGKTNWKNGLEIKHEGKNKKKYKILTCSPQQVFVSFHDQHNVEISTARINVQHQSSLCSALCCVNGVLHLLHRGRSGKAFTEVTEVISVMVRFLT